MQYLALVLFAPWFMILSWVYWAWPKSHVVTPARRRLDVAALVLALFLSVAAMNWSYSLPFENAGKLWPQVIATLAGYHVFLAVLALAWIVRRSRYATDERLYSSSSESSLD